MRYPRSFLVLSLVVSVLLVVLSACGGTAPAAPTAAPAAKSTAAPAAGAPTAAPAAAAPTAAPAAKVTEYNVSATADFSGPYADVFKFMDPARRFAIAYWNDTKGKGIGVKINVKTFDARYDPSIVASTWPGVLSGDKPIMMLGTGGPDVAALQQRLPTDKVPMLMSTGGYGYGWLPNQWIFQPRPTYPHEVAGFLNWVLSNWKENRPVRIAEISNEGPAAYKDIVNGVKNYVEKVLQPQGKAEFVGVEWVALQPTDVSSEVKRLVDKKADFIHINTNTAQVVAALRALEQYKAKDTKLLLSSHNGITASAKASSATGDLKDLEGHFDVYAMAASNDLEAEAYKIYQQNKDKYGFGSLGWDLNTIQGMMHGIFAGRAVERAAKAVGPDKITGEAIYNAMFGAPFTSKELLGTLSDLNFTKDAPFPTSNMKVRITTVKDGNHVLATPDWIAIPDVPKW